MDVAVADTAADASGVVAVSVEAPADAVRDPTDVLRVDMGQLTRAFALVTADGFGVRGPVTAVEATTAGGVQDDLHGGRGEAGLMGM